MDISTSSVSKGRLGTALLGNESESDNEEFPHDVERTSDNGTSDPKQEVHVEELLQKKRARRSKPFTEDILVSTDGLVRIYTEFPSMCGFQVRGFEAKYLKRLMARYREWAFQLHPGLAFTDVMQKCELLGAKGKTRACLQELRDNERNRFIEESVGVSRSDMAVFYGKQHSIPSPGSNKRTPTRKRMIDELANDTECLAPSSVIEESKNVESSSLAGNVLTAVDQ